MCSDIVRYGAALLVVLSVSCTSVRQLSEISRAKKDVDVSIPVEVEEEEDTETDTVAEETVRDSGPSIMNAVKDMDTGEMVAVDVINASRVVARFRNVAERAGKVTVEFDVSVPSDLVNSQWQLRLFPEVDILGDRLSLEPILITGDRYRARQMRGYERYREFIASIIRDSSGFIMVRPLEIFLERNYPQIYRMKNDTTVVSDQDAENIFGVTKREVLLHYTRSGLAARNEKKKKKSEMMLEKLTGGIQGMIRLDTVIVSGTDICYRYVQTLSSRPGLKKIPVTLAGGVYENGDLIYELPGKNRIDFYVSSLSTLADCSPHFKTVVVERNVYDYTNAILDFGPASSELDTLSEVNASELARVRAGMRKMMGMSEFETDSVVVTASCSLEGKYRYNVSLADRRAETVVNLLSATVGDNASEILKKSSVPENWKLFTTIVANDSTVTPATRSRVLSLPYAEHPDSSETVLQGLPEYRYFREKIYPRLRIVRLDFYMHRKDMAKDTVCTSEIDTAYMKGVEALKELDYNKAVELLGSYKDYNTALAYLSSGYDRKALEILCDLEQDSPRVLYLEALALSRLGREKEASEIYSECVEMDRSMLHRGRLDPEIQKFTLKYDN